MLPTPCTSHVPFDRVYEPAEDSFLLLDTLSSPSETAFLASRFPCQCTEAITTPSPFTVEVGPGSGVVLAFLTAHAQTLFSRPDIVTLGVDVNWFACKATGETVRKAVKEAMAPKKTGAGQGEGNGYKDGTGYFLSAVQGDLTSALRPGEVDVLVFNPPYVPTDSVPEVFPTTTTSLATGKPTTTYEEDSCLLALSYAGGKDGMEVTDRLIAQLPQVLSSRGVAYLLLCAQNKPEEVKKKIRSMEGGGPNGWRAETVGTSGKKAGWEKLQIVRIWRDI
ncbi:uncharacterized protein CTHT_0003340 [Thermochaetoides thermophila DSM 1495]|uniref:Uncharacterized protein n=1 Tax=Chaetomium thermophilum (strain DSM 1495 / CBS 144.50 / IMI 039719) TaxID=759272 RepID=G0RZL1_CHATD|nr:hypothetical protein CTHT_0003340 [Thermochaetoides thermophila DSM 1495]EGS23639.1 hypothetical protein CTHT_0003340 [Thermochaetoides thermophila DSM 1495]